MRVNGKLIHSRLKIKAFPDFDEVVKICIGTGKGVLDYINSKLTSTSYALDTFKDLKTWLDKLHFLFEARDGLRILRSLSGIY